VGGCEGGLFQATAELAEASVGFVNARKPGLNLDEWAMCDPDQSYMRVYVFTCRQGGSLLCFVPTQFPCTETAEDERGKR